jgi:hypothetical protein
MHAGFHRNLAAAGFGGMDNWKDGLALTGVCAATAGLVRRGIFGFSHFVA